ncbi:hypothetical protein PGT21_037014 [Puccinia graminis f. sp. tritici]|uniref:Uncharacterized protein n=1 Tax=Puccinia graminis f. sp. tritici TaxID=56615 RepID=A0A5B0NR14_PUCGR|nr:hypothetical protein PGT21_036682 [Puccinia graminis f. sp. tritici]KAA1111177.1 hypothetical protein PGT21_037014 [Puccinia graminis f. sp. tritici]KAA1127575.1 hypothetical protein PGTUg99_002916 [Puccinia graminis f. sp. tritici]KAA1134406.1 hypothetical protein PGTUg99_000804 [Puccinia graminis f. sp. tritici]KAA1138774.1 hypothetical protein PGTUg99_004856 [Puccinia graminis f. sp. tritici]
MVEYPSKSSNWSSQTRAHMAETGYNQCGFLCRLDLWDASASARAVSLCQWSLLCRFSSEALREIEPVRDLMQIHPASR